jgi:hypothetical protein
MIPYEIDAAGWFKSINGRPVIKNDLSAMSHTTFAMFAPNGLLWHYTASCNDDTSGGIKARGYLTHALAVGRDGTVRQYAPLLEAASHAFDAARYKVGVEHTALPGSCDLTDVQLQASAELFAAVIMEIKVRVGVTVPLVHVTGCDYKSPGLKEHKDGVGCDWDPNTHTDALYGWGWPKYLAAIAAAMTQEEDMQDFIEGSRARQKDLPLDTTKSAEWQFGWFMENRIERATTLPKPTPSSGVSKADFDAHTADPAAHHSHAAVKHPGATP